VIRPPAVFGPRDTDVFEFFRMAHRGTVVVPAGERWLTVAWVGDVVRAVVAAAAGSAGQIAHIGSADPMPIDELVQLLCSAGGVSARIVRIPLAAVTVAGVVGGGLRMLGAGSIALTRDKARELKARHWSSRSSDSMLRLGVTPEMSFADAAAATWSWYRQRGWIAR
jgi:nucleoside-diphosphate-sugar epimerase